MNQSETFLGIITHISNQIDGLAEDIIDYTEKGMLDFNSVAEQLKSLNNQIFNATVKGE